MKGRNKTSCTNEHRTLKKVMEKDEIRQLHKRTQNAEKGNGSCTEDDATRQLHG